MKQENIFCTNVLLQTLNNIPQNAPDICDLTAQKSRNIRLVK